MSEERTWRGRHVYIGELVDPRLWFFSVVTDPDGEVYVEFQTDDDVKPDLIVEAPPCQTPS